MKSNTFKKKKLPALLRQSLSFGTIIALSLPYSYAITKSFGPGDHGNSTPTDLSSEAPSQLWVNENATSVSIYSSQNYSLEETGGDSGPRVAVLPGGQMTFNTKELLEESGYTPNANGDGHRIKLINSAENMGALTVGVSSPDHETPPEEITTDKTIFKGQYLDIVSNVKAAAVQGQGNRTASGESIPTDFSLKDTTITAISGISWDDGDAITGATASTLNLSNIKINSSDYALSVSTNGRAGDPEQTKVYTDNLNVNNTKPGKASINFNGDRIDAKMNNTTITTFSGLEASNGAQIKMTGLTNIKAADASSDGQRGIYARGKSAETNTPTQIHIDQLNLEFQSTYNGENSGAVVAGTDGKIVVGNEANKNIRSSINIASAQNKIVYAINANDRGNIILNNTDILNQHPESGQISTKAMAIKSDNGGNVVLNNSTITMKEANGAWADHQSKLTLDQQSSLYADKLAVKLVDGSTLNVYGGSTITGGETAIFADRGALVTANIDNSYVYARQINTVDPSGTAFMVAEPFNDDAAYLNVNINNNAKVEADFLYQVNKGELNLKVNHSEISGGAIVATPWDDSEPRNIANVSMENRAKWYFVQDNNQMLPPNYLNATKVNLDNSEILFSRPKSDQDFQNIAIGTLEGKNGGVIQLWTLLQDRNDASDKVIIREKATGTTALRIMRFDSAVDGKQTTGDGIKVVEAIDGATTDNNAFILDKKSTGYRASDAKPSLVAGAYDYYLKKGSDSETESWYLNSQEHKDPVKPTEYRPEVDTYFANRQQAIAMQQHRWQERSEGKQSQDQIAWIRLKNSHDSFDNQFNHDRKADLNLIHFGSDVWQKNFTNDSRLKFGAMALVGEAKTKSQNSYLKSEGKTKGYNIGLYGTWQQFTDSEKGLYVDGWVMQGWFDNDIKGAGLERESYDSKTLSTSIETGYGILLTESEASRFYLQPQAQVIWSKFSADNVREKTGTYVNNQNDSATSYRMGLRFKADIKTNNQKLISPFAEINYWRMPTLSSIDFNHLAANDKTPRNIMETTLGVKAQLTQKIDVSGRVSYDIGDRKYRRTNLQLGLGYQW